MAGAKVGENGFFIAGEEIERGGIGWSGTGNGDMKCSTG